MNRNVESHFAIAPQIDIQRSRFDRSQDVKLSFNVGQLVPFYVDEVLPGDTFDVTTSKVVRLQTLLTPVMDNIYLDTYFFFVPNRIIWEHWKQFMGENTESAWLPTTTYSIPQIVSARANGTDDGFISGSVEDYLGLPVGVPGLSVSSLPYRAYMKIWSEWFRSEQLQDPDIDYTGDGTTYQSNTASAYNHLMPVDKYHDYFTSCTVAPQFGSVTMAPITGSINTNSGQSMIPVVPINVQHDVTYPMTGRIYNSSGSQQNTLNYFLRSDGAAQVVDLGGSLYNYSYAPNNLYTASNAIASSLGVDILSLRNAFQIQKLLERDATSGTRYTEIIAGHFSVQSPDARLQRPEYLGGNRVPISIHQIVNQSQGQSDFLGDLGAMSLTTDKNEDFIFSSTEHGYIIGVCCARYDHSYPQGIERFWSRKDRFDFYWPELANISAMAVLNKEIYAQGNSADEEVFGYQEPWADYRYKPNHVTSEMRPGISNSLASWHFADYYESQPYLSSDWIKEDKSNVDRTLAVQSSNANQIFADIYIQNYTTRPMPTYSIPGLADHH